MSEEKPVTTAEQQDLLDLYIKENWNVSSDFRKTIEFIYWLGSILDTNQMNVVIKNGHKIPSPEDYEIAVDCIKAMTNAKQLLLKK